jgi:hypothetical protein
VQCARQTTFQSRVNPAPSGWKLTRPHATASGPTSKSLSCELGQIAADSHSCRDLLCALCELAVQMHPSQLSHGSYFSQPTNPGYYPQAGLQQQQQQQQQQLQQQPMPLTQHASAWPSSSSQQPAATWHGPPASYHGFPAAPNFGGGGHQQYQGLLPDQLLGNSMDEGADDLRAVKDLPACFHRLFCSFRSVQLECSTLNHLLPAPALLLKGMEAATLWPAGPHSLRVLQVLQPRPERVLLCGVPVGHEHGALPLPDQLDVDSS